MAVGAAGLLAVTTVGLVDPETVALGWRCPLRSLTGLQCPGCGGTRALHLLVRGKPVAAARMNVIVVALAPASCVLMARWLKGRSQDAAPTPPITPAQLRIAVGALTAFGVMRIARPGRRRPQIRRPQLQSRDLPAPSRHGASDRRHELQPLVCVTPPGTSTTATPGPSPCLGPDSRGCP
jgi:hypothetical protein